MRGVWVLCVLLCLAAGGDAALSTEQQQALLDKHNTLRSAEGASNMRYMVSICRGSRVDTAFHKVSISR